MGEWLVRHFTVVGIQGQNWMLIALAIIAVGIVVSWWIDRYRPGLVLAPFHPPVPF
jgi:hypothetical protein